MIEVNISSSTCFTHTRKCIKLGKTLKSYIFYEKWIIQKTELQTDILESEIKSGEKKSDIFIFNY